MRNPMPGILFTVVIACSGSTTGGGADGGAGSGGSGGSGGASAYCPPAPPTSGGACVPRPSTGLMPASADCSYGDDPRPACRTTAVCANDGTWTIVTPDATACAAPPLPPACPSAHPAAQSACADTSLACWYDDGTRCWCSACKFGSEYPVCQTIDPPEWSCATPPTGCPTVMPQAGMSCSTPGTECGPSCELSIVCEDAVWKWKHGNCPICASPDTPIATPSGERAIAELRVGDLVYSVDHDAIVVVPIARAASTPVFQHHVMRIALVGGRVLEISPGHPTADGRTFGELHAGSLLDSAHPVLDADLVPYAFQRTYDILPASSTGDYFAAGALVGSTLARGGSR